MKLNFLLKSLLCVCLVSFSQVLASLQSAKLEQSVSSDATMNEEIEKLITVIKEICLSNPKSIFCNRKEIAEQLRKKMGDDSSLYPFPHLSVLTYEQFSKAMRKSLQEQPDRAPYLLHLWSYMTGIPVIGLRHGRKYYEYDNHLIPEATVDECKNLTLTTTSPKFCVTVNRKGEPIQRNLDMPHSVFHSAWAFVKEQKEFDKENELEESPQIAWSLLRDELVSFQEIENSKICTLLKKFLLKRNTKVSRKNVYSFGLIRLLQNTALYISLAEENSSEILVSPCSKDVVRFLGFQDGIFIEGNVLSAKNDTLHRLVGKLCFLRAFFRKIPCFEEYPEECLRCRQSVRGLFFPHYSLSLANEGDQAALEKYRTCEINETLPYKQEQFAQDFCRYITGNEVPAIRNLLNYLDKQQVSIVLSGKGSLPRRLFNPSYSLSLDSRVVGKDETTDTDTFSDAQSFIRLVIEHLKTLDYQNTSKIDLSNNKLRNKELSELGKAFKSNILPHLWQLDLTKNNLGKSGVRALRPLLERDAFTELRIDNPEKNIPSDFMDNLTKKIVRQ